MRVRHGVFCFIALLLASCGPSSDSRSDASNAPLTIGVPEGNVGGSEFGVGELVNQITREGLTQVGIDGRARPRLARSWEWENEDRRLRVRLRDDVVLHDGRSFDSQLAAEALAIAIPSNRGQYPALLDVTAAIPDGPFELLLDVARPSALLPEDLTVLLNVAAGPYRETNRGDSLVEFERFERYYLGTPAIERIELRTFDTLRTTWASLLRGELDVVYDVPADAIEFVRNDDVQVVTVPRWYQFAIAFNAKSAALRSAEVRRALNLAIDRDALVNDVLRGAGSPSHDALWPEYWAYDRSMVPPTFDPSRASAMLDAAGFKMAPSTRDDQPPARLRFTCILPANFAVWERIALKVQKDLFDIGVDMRIEVLPRAEFTGRIRDGQFDSVLLDMISGPTPGRAYILWASKQHFAGDYNVFGYENPEAEKLFEVVRTSRDEAAVRAATRRLQRVLLEDPPAVFLAWTERTRAIDRDIVTPKTDTHDVMWTLWNWSRSPVRVASRQ